MNITLPIKQIQSLWAILATKRHSKDFPTIRVGSKDEAAIAWLRGYLRKAGFPVKPTGPFDEALGNVVEALQEDERLLPDRTVGKMTWGLLIEYPMSPMPIQPETISHNVARLNTLLNPEVWSQCGYYSSTMDDSEKPYYGLRKAGAAQRALAATLGYKAQYGLSCGHFGDFLVKLYLGQDDPKTRRTGMNLSCFRTYRDCPPLPRASNCGAGLFGPQVRSFEVPEKKPWTTTVRGLYGAGLERLGKLDPTRLTLVEEASHVICYVPVEQWSGIKDPRTGLLARLGGYRVAADGGSSKAGKPWTFRRWRSSDDRGIHYWAVNPGVENSPRQSAWING
jgi:hypothetical protein